MLDDAVTLLRHGVAPEMRPDRTTLEAMARTAGAFLNTVGTESLAGGVEPLPPPDLAPLRAAGIPTVSDADFEAAIAADGQRRRQLAGLLAHDGRTGGAWERRRRSLAGE